MTVHHGDALTVLRALPDQSVDAVVTDPPYGLSREPDAAEVLRHWLAGDDYAHTGGGFMGKTWDSFVPGPSVWRECLRVLKPGGHLLCFAGSRTVDLMGLSIRLAGFEMRDSIAWLYGSGFPKSLDVSKAIDRAAGATREVIGTYVAPDGNGRDASKMEAGRGVSGLRQAGGFAGGYEPGARLDSVITAPATPAAQQWQGWGTALKPAFEPIVVARRPLSGTVASNVLAHGTGALNIDACRVAHDEPAGKPHVGNGGARSGGIMGAQGRERVRETTAASTAGRWPTNVVLDDSQAAALDQQSGPSRSRVGKPRGAASGDGWRMTATGAEYDDEGGTSRFFPTFRYQAKAPTRERPKVGGVAHPTVKPLDLMRWLVRLVTPPGGTVLDPFAGSGTTVEACALEGFECEAIELTAEYLPLIDARLERCGYMERDAAGDEAAS